MQVFGAKQDTAGFSEAEREVVLQARLLYDISPHCVITPMSADLNVEYLIEDKRSGLYTVLRISRPELCGRDALDAEILWIKELDKHAPPFMLPQPIAGTDGGVVQKIVLPDGGTYLCTMFAYLHGRPLSDHEESQLVSDFRKLGEVTALMHQNALQWNGSETLARPVLDCSVLLGSQNLYTLRAGCETVKLPNDALALFDKTGSVIRRRLFKFGKSGARFGLIHSELSLSNIICYKNRFAVTHFDRCGFGWFLYDFASSVSYMEDHPLLPSLTTAWLEGYRMQRNISNEESAELPTFVMLRRLELLGRLVRYRDPVASKGFTADFIEKTAALAERYLSAVQ